jgi:hypothetical protein
VAKKPKAKGKAPEWTTLTEALGTFATWAKNTQSEGHIRPLHFYTASRLVVEGGFHPDAVTPRPPFRVERADKLFRLIHDPASARPGEDTVFGGLKTKDVDVVVALPRIGPVVAVSMKGSLNAFRNLTNRMEEAAGDCTNIHLAYPGLVYAFWHIMRGTMSGVAPPGTPKMFNLDDDGQFFPADVAIRADGGLTSFLARYLFAMSRLSGRTDMRADPSSYEAVGVTFADVAPERIGQPMSDHPGDDSPLHYRKMFATIYEQCDLRFVYQSPALKGTTERMVWAEASPAFVNMRPLDYEPRIGEPSPEEEEADQMEEKADEQE